MQKVIILSPKDTTLSELFNTICLSHLKEEKKNLLKHDIEYMQVLIDLKNIPHNILDKLEELNPIVIVPIGMDLAKLFDPDISFIKDKELFYLNKVVIIPVFTQFKLENFISSVSRVALKYKEILEKGTVINDG